MLKKIITKTRIKILLVVLVSFLVVKNGASKVFLTDSPRINPEFITRIKNAPKELAKLFNKNSDFADVKTVTPPSDIAFKAISKGVYAGEDSTGKSYLKVEAGTKYRIVGTVTINGKEYPKIEFIQ